MAGRDTIAAIATGSARAGLGVVRVSGPGSEAVARAVLGRVPPARHASYGRFTDGDGGEIDRGIALFFPAPGSYTGEDVLELHAHGSRPVLEMLLERVLAAGARPARPGEFTERAFLEGRLDLAQAEAVADLIDAGSRTAARAARATLRGVFSRRVEALADALTAARVQVEAQLDFTDEDIDEPDDAQLAGALAALSSDLAATLEAAVRGARLSDGLRAVLLGPPNAGKSSILNRLAGHERAIVTAMPGTTRDVVHESVRVGDAQVELVDTAGLRAGGDDVERIGIARAIEQAQAADLVLLVVDDGEGAEAGVQVPEVDVEVVVVRNKVDLTGSEPGEHDGAVHVSALTGAGMEALAGTLAGRAARYLGEGEFSARQRHVVALRAAGAALDDASSALGRGEGMELVAEELRRAQLSLGEITGTVTSDDLLGAIFSTFCIGK